MRLIIGVQCVHMNKSLWLSVASFWLGSFHSLQQHFILVPAIWSEMAGHMCCRRSISAGSKYSRATAAAVLIHEEAFLAQNVWLLNARPSWLKQITCNTAQHKISDGSSNFWAEKHFVTPQLLHTNCACQPWADHSLVTFQYWIIDYSHWLSRVHALRTRHLVWTVDQHISFTT